MSSNSPSHPSRRQLRELEGARARIARPRIALRRRIAKKLFSFLVLACCGLLLVGLSVPASAFELRQRADLAGGAAASREAQSLTVDGTAAAPVARDLATVTSYAELLREKFGNRNYSYRVGSGTIRWPFPYAVPITDGWGDRLAPCSGCSSFHKGVDFTPGVGTPIYAIADGVVTVAEASAWGFGTHVIIEHSIAGKTVTSVYAHMQSDSSPLAVGDIIAVGDFIGLVGSTGAATGPHLHLEIRLGGEQVDPFAWLTTNAA